MNKQNNQIEYHKEREEYIPHNNSHNKDAIFKKLKQARVILFFAPIVHVGASIVFLILLLIGLIAKNKLGFTLNTTQSALAFAYIGTSVLIDCLVFMLPARKAKKKSQFRIMAIITLILSTLILTGSFLFWGIPTLLFYSVITLIVWVFEVIAAVYLILVVEALPN
ncbi:MAG: hypothetical protein ACRC8P_00880 [Spiroplasma sp.]